MTKFVKAIKDFSGGLSEVANDNIPENRLVTAKNAVPGDGYGIARATGTAVAFERIPTEEPQPVVMMAELEDSSEVVHIIACTSFETESGTRWNLWDWSGDEWTLATWSGSNDTAIRPMKSWFVYANKLFWLDGTDFSCYDGSSIADVPNAQSLDTEFWELLTTSVAVVQRNTRWFYATKNNEIIITDVGYYDKFGSTSVTKISSGVADKITALHLFNEGILIFQERSIYYLSGWDIAGGSDIKLTKLSVECGTHWPKSVKTISNAVLYLGDNGVYRLSIPYNTSSIAAKNISEQQASKRLTETPALDVYAEVFNGIYYISLRTASEIKEYRLYLDSGSWWGEYTQRAYSYAAKLGGDDHLYLGCENGYMLYYDSNSYHYISTETGTPAAIPMEIVTKGYDVVGATVVDSKVKRVFVVLRQYVEEHSGLSVQVKTDYLDGAYAAEVDSMHRVMTAVLQDIKGDESLVWSEGEYSQTRWGWTDTVTKMFQLNRKCKRAQFIFWDDNKDEPLLIYGVALLFKKKKAKGSRLGVTPQPITYIKE